MPSINFLLPFVDLVGGVKSTFEIAGRLAKRGWDVRVYYPIVHSNVTRKENWVNSLRNIFRKLTRKSPGIFDFGIAVQVEEVPFFHNFFIRKADFVLATWWEDVLPLAKLHGSRGLKVHVVRHHETWHGDLEKLAEVYRLPLPRIVISSWLADLMHKQYGQLDTHLCPNGLDSSNFFYEPRERDKSQSLKIGMMYRDANPTKGMEFGFEVLRAISVRCPKAEIVLFGDPLKVLPNFPHRSIERPFGSDLRRIYSNLDIFLFTSNSEGFGNPPLEAMACRTAVISTPVGGVPDYCHHGESGFLVEYGDLDGFIQCFDRLATEHTELKRIATKAEQTAKIFTWEVTVDRFESILDTLSIRSRLLR